MTLRSNLKEKFGRLVDRAGDEHAARQERGEADVAGDSGVAGSRAGSDGADGNYVGRTSPQFDAEDQQSGAEARSEAQRGADH